MKVLVADVARTATLLAGHEVTTARTIAQARSALQKGEFGLLVVGATFDDSRMFDLVREIRSEARYDGLRVVCIVPTRTLAPACEALRAEAVLEGELTSAAALISAGMP
jgi:DNA-binding NtrC family response regulator